MTIPPGSSRYALPISRATVVVDVSHKPKRSAPQPPRTTPRGERFGFAEYTFDPEGVGTIRTESGESTNGEGGSEPATVVVLIDPEGVAGIAMTASDALRLAQALIGAAMAAREPIEV